MLRNARAYNSHAIRFLQGVRENMQTLKKTSRTSLRKMIAEALRDEEGETKIELYNKYGCFVATLEKFDRYCFDEPLKECVGDIMEHFYEYDDYWAYYDDLGRYCINVAFTTAYIKGKEKEKER